jgi:hypothetical protein
MYPTSHLMLIAETTTARLLGSLDLLDGLFRSTHMRPHIVASENLLREARLAAGRSVTKLLLQFITLEFKNLRWMIN